MNNNMHRTNIKPGWLSILMLSILPWLAGCQTAEWPFEAQKAGAKIEVEFRASEHRGYFFILSFMHKKYDREESDRISKLLGDGAINKNGEFVNPGIPILLHLRIRKIDSAEEPPVFDQAIPALGISAWGSEAVRRHIAIIPLKPGRYRISVESLQDVPELVGIPIVFSIGMAAKTRPIS